MSALPRRWQVLSTLSITVLSAASSLLGLLRPGHYAGAQSVLARTRAEDLVILAVAVPVLVLGLWYARRGSLRGQFVWLGALAFMTYMWASRAFSTPFNDFFLGYVALFTLSTFTLVGGLTALDAAAVRRRLAGRLPRRLYSAVLGLTALALALLWLSEIVPATLSGTTPAIVQEFGPLGATTYVVDLGLVVPSLAVAAVWLSRGRAWGYVATGVLLVFAALLAPALTAITLVDLGAGVSMTLPMVVGTVLPPLVGAAFAVGYLRAIPRREPAGAVAESGLPG